MSMWIEARWVDTREREPLIAGEYMAQTVYGRVTTITYTPEGGWNTYYESDGTPSNDGITKFEWSRYIVRWLDVPEPPAVPKEWKDEYREIIR